MKFQIENYENMTPEEKLAALEAYEPDMSGFVSKATFDKTASELAAAKKSLKEKMSEEEAKALKDAEEKAELLARVKQLEDEKMLNTYVNSYLAMGYDEKLAKSSAEALVKGDMETVFKLQRTHAETQEKTLRAELLKQTPQPQGGNSGSEVTVEKFQKMSLIEKQKFATENPEQYKLLFGGN